MLCVCRIFLNKKTEQNSVSFRKTTPIERGLCPNGYFPLMRQPPVTKNPLRKKCQNPMYSTASFLFSVRFVSDAALLRSLLCLVCRSSDSSIQAARLIAACDLAPYCQRIASAFSPGHDSPSNDRFSPHAGISRMENNTLESQLLSESCRVLAISNVQTADPAMDSFRVRDLHPIPLFSEQACVSDLPREAGSKLSP